MFLHSHYSSAYLGLHSLKLKFITMSAWHVTVLVWLDITWDTKL